MELRKFAFVLMLGQYATSVVSAQCPGNTYGPECRYDCHCAPENVARGSATWQSSTLENYFKSSAAVDGKVGRQYLLPCSHTGQDTPAVWYVTLNQIYDIYRFRIYNRGENFGKRLNGFVISVWNSPTTSSFCYNDTTTSQSGPGDIIYGKCQSGSPIQGNRVQIQIPSGYLTLCEVLLYVCSDGTYGEYCDSYCGGCRDNNPCNKETGVCPGTAQTRCKNEFTGEKCDECIPGRWSQNCAVKCGHCLNDAMCDRQTGNCPLVGTNWCKTGFREPHCQVCIPGRWGQTCQSQCGQCLHDNACDGETGHCPLVGTNRCKGDFLEPFCQVCPDGRFGKLCEESCGQCLDENLTCNHVDGTCSNCAPGWQGDHCKLGCPPGKYGPSCELTCSTNCIGGPTECDIYTGKCFGGCIDGFTGDYCTAPETSSTGIIIGSVIGSIGVVIAIVAVVVCVRRSKKKHPSEGASANPINTYPLKTISGDIGDVASNIPNPSEEYPKYHNVERDNDNTYECIFEKE